MTNTPVPQKVHVIIRYGTDGKADIVRDPLPSVSPEIMVCLVALVGLKVKQFVGKTEELQKDFDQRSARIVPGKLSVSYNANDGPEARDHAEAEAIRAAKEKLKPLESQLKWYWDLINMLETGLADLTDQKLPTQKFIDYVSGQIPALEREFEKAETDSIAAAQLGAHLGAVRNFGAIILAHQAQLAQQESTTPES